MDKAIQKIINKYPCFEETSHNKLHCTLTGHDVPAKKEALQQYVDTKKFQRSWGVKLIMDEYGEWFEDLGKGRFGCKVTKKIVADEPEDLRRHVTGPKFLKCLPKFKEQQALAEQKAKEKALRKGIPMSDDEDMKDEEEEAIVSDDQEEGDEEIESEYPELDNTAAANNSVDEDSYDFSVMDTDVDNEPTTAPKKKTGGKRKKIVKNGTKAASKMKRLA